MSEKKNFLDELNKFAGSAISSAVQAKDSMIELMREYMEAFWKSKNAVSREEFEVLKARVEKLQSAKKSTNNSPQKKKSE